MLSTFSDLPALIFVTGGCGFIGSAVVRLLLAESDARVVNIDKLTYAASEDSVGNAAGNPRYTLVREDICDQAAMRSLFEQHRPGAILHLAAESHVDRSIDGPGAFVQTNIVGTYALLEEARRYWGGLDEVAQRAFRFQHISTDEVFGSLGADGFFTETTPYDPSSPYSASKAASDHLVRAWHRTFGLPTVVTNCSNNYGPYQFPEKLIPLMILNGIEGKKLPVYGKGENVRDWLYVEDHARALVTVLARGAVGETYNIGGLNEARNIDVVRTICAELDALLPNSAHRPHEQLITNVTDRPGHDARYAIDPAKIMRELDWTPRETFETGLRRTIAWYLENRPWWEALRSRVYAGGRLGLSVGVKA